MHAAKVSFGINPENMGKPIPTLNRTTFEPPTLLTKIKVEDQLVILKT